LLLSLSGAGNSFDVKPLWKERQQDAADDTGFTLRLADEIRAFEKVCACFHELAITMQYSRHLLAKLSLL